MNVVVQSIQHGLEGTVAANVDPSGNLTATITPHFYSKHGRPPVLYVSSVDRHGVTIDRVAIKLSGLNGLLSVLHHPTKHVEPAYESQEPTS